MRSAQDIQQLFEPLLPGLLGIELTEVTQTQLVLKR